MTMLSDNRGGEEVKLPLKSKAVGSNRQKEGRGLVKNNDDDDRDDDDRDDDSDDDRDDDDNTTSLLTAMVPSDRSIYQSISISLFYLLGIVGLTLKEAQQQILHHQE